MDIDIKIGDFVVVKDYLSTIYFFDPNEISGSTFEVVSIGKTSVCVRIIQDNGSQTIVPVPEINISEVISKDRIFEENEIVLLTENGANSIEKREGLEEGELAKGDRILVGKMFLGLVFVGYLEKDPCKIINFHFSEVSPLNVN